MAVFATPFQNSKEIEKSVIKVYLRTRPLLDKEVLEGAQNILQVLPNENQVSLTSSFLVVGSRLFLKRL